MYWTSKKPPGECDPEAIFMRWFRFEPVVHAGSRAECWCKGPLP